MSANASSPSKGRLRGARPPSGRRESGSRPPITSPTRAGELRLFSGIDGRVLRQAEVPTTWASPVYADLDGDGRPEVVTGSWAPGPSVIAFEAASFTRLWEYAPPGQVWRGLASGKVGAGGVPGLLVGLHGGRVLALDGSGAELWSRDLDQAIFKGFTASDVNNDGLTDVLTRGGARDERRLVALDGRDGAELWGIDDLDLWAPPLVLERGPVRLLVPTAARGLVALDQQHRIVWTVPAGKNASNRLTRAAVADIDGDGGEEVVAGYGDGVVRVVDLESGKLRWQYHTGEPGIEAAPLVLDVDGDGRQEIIIAGLDRRLVCVQAPKR